MQEGWTPLHIAQDNNNLMIGDLLLRNEANPDLAGVVTVIFSICLGRLFAMMFLTPSILQAFTIQNMTQVRSCTCGSGWRYSTSQSCIPEPLQVCKDARQKRQCFSCVKNNSKYFSMCCIISPETDQMHVRSLTVLPIESSPFDIKAYWFRPSVSQQNPCFSRLYICSV